MSHITLFVFYKEKHSCLHALYRVWTISCYNKNISGLVTHLVVKHNIQISTKWFSISIIWNVIIISYISTKDTGLNLPLMHFKISFKTRNIQHNINSNSVPNYALSPKVSFHLGLIGLKGRTGNSSLSHHYHCGKPPYKIQPSGSPHMKITKRLEELKFARLKFRNKL